MNWIDIIIIVPLLWALYRGWRSGIVPQVGVIAGLVVGIALAYFIGEGVTEWLNIGHPVGKAVAYIAVAGVALICVVLTAQMVSGAIHATGAGALDSFFGALLGLLKMAIIVSVALCGFQWLNDRKEMIAQDTLEKSLLYYPVTKLTSYALPFAQAAGEQIDRWHEQDDQATDERQIEKARDGFQDHR